MLKFCRSRLDDVNYGYALDNMLRERDLPIEIDNIPDDSTENASTVPNFNDIESEDFFESYLQTDYEDRVARGYEGVVDPTQSQITQATPDGVVDAGRPKRNRTQVRRYTPG